MEQFKKKKTADCLITIIIPVFNSEHYLVKCLDSVINQTHTQLQIIIVNDGSTDSSLSIINEYRLLDSRFLVINKTNGGIGSAYKAAFDVITGDYILFVDSDDWLELNAVEKIFKLIIDNAADMVSFGIKPINEKGEEIRLKNLDNIDSIINNNSEIIKTHYEILKHPTLVRLYKKELFNNIIIFEQNIGIDEMLTPQLLLKCNKIVYTSEVYYNALIRQDSVCRSSYTSKKVMELIKVNQFVSKFMENNIPNYVHIAYNKYLNTLFDILHEYIKSKNNLPSDLINDVRIELSETYIKIKSSLIFKKQSKHLRISMIFMVQAFGLYKMLYNLLKNQK